MESTRRNGGESPRTHDSGGIISRPVLVLAVVCLVLGCLFGRFVLGAFGGTSAISGKTTLSADELDTVVGTYTYNGLTYEMTAREVIEDSSSLDNAAAEDGTFAMPTADEILAYARNEILNRVVESEGIEVSDEEVSAFAASYAGSSDYSAIASTWGIDEETAEQILRETCALAKLRDRVVGSTTELVAPTAPDTCEDGEEDVATQGYGAYIVGLLGDEWDSENETWARTDGVYYESMSTMSFSSTSATYNQAMSAYYVAYMTYVESYSTMSEVWTNYVNELLSTAQINIYTLVA